MTPQRTDYRCRPGRARSMTGRRPTSRWARTWDRIGGRRPDAASLTKCGWPWAPYQIAPLNTVSWPGLPGGSGGQSGSSSDDFTAHALRAPAGPLPSFT